MMLLPLQATSRFSSSACSSSTSPIPGAQCVGCTRPKCVCCICLSTTNSVPPDHLFTGGIQFLTTTVCHCRWQIFPMHVKSKAVSITTCGNWVTNMVFGYYTPVRDTIPGPMLRSITVVCLEVSSPASDQIIICLHISRILAVIRWHTSLIYGHNRDDT